MAGLRCSIARRLIRNAAQDVTESLPFREVVAWNRSSLGEKSRRYCTLIPVSCLCQRARSRVTKAPNSSGLPPSGVKPSSPDIERIARLGDRGVDLCDNRPGRADRDSNPFHEPNSRSGKPASATLGISGRRAAVTPEAAAQRQARAEQVS
jgi:hypothetical protein